MVHAKQDTIAIRWAHLRHNYVHAALAVLATLLFLTLMAFLARSAQDSLLGGQHIEPFRRQLHALHVFRLVALHFVLFLSPGAALLMLLGHRRISPLDAVMTCVALSALVGYATFWVYFFDPRWGRYFSVTVAVVSIAGLVGLGCASRRARDTVRSLLAEPDVRSPLALMFLAAMFYAGFLGWFDRQMGADVEAQTRLMHQFPPDNVLPRIFAEKLYAGADPRPLFDNWLSSDRPPLQTGLVLLQWPFFGRNVDRNYQIMGTIFQCIWIPAVWSLCRTVNLSRRRTGLIVLFCMMSGFFLLNCIFVWPKLLAGGLVVWAFTLLLQPLLGKTKPTPAAAVTAGVAAALGLLSHGGVAFTLIALAIFFLLPRYFIGVRQTLLGCIAFGLLLTPWILYKNYYEPPANRLLKWYLAGIKDIDPRTTWQAVKDQYGPLNIGEIAVHKFENVASMFPGRNCVKNLECWRVTEFGCVVAALGILNLAWPVLGMSFANRRWKARCADRRSVQPILVAALLSILVWVVVVFGGDLAVIHQGSYATMILLYVGLCTLILSLPRPVVVLVYLVQAADFLVVWVATTPLTLPLQERLRLANPPMIVASLSVFAAIVAFVLWPRSDNL